MASEKKGYDIIVIGGGIAGAAAALQSSRSGFRTAILEKTVFWGGLATSGLVPIFMPLCDGEGRQVTFGIAEELLKLSIKYGPGQIPDQWRAERKKGEKTWSDAYSCERLYPGANLDKRYMTVFSPVSFVFGLDAIMESSGIDLWLDTLACSPIVRGEKVVGVEVENKSGRISLEASCVIDCSGDADMAYRSGAPCLEWGSYPTYLYQYASLSLARESVDSASARRLVTYRGRGRELDDGERNAGRRYSAVSGREVSEFVMACRKLAREDLAREHAKGGDSSRENLFPTALPSVAQYRRSRRIDGMDTIRSDHRNRYCQDSVGLIADCRQREAIWEVPYGCLLPRGVDNLLVAGRCSSAEGYAWHVARLIPGAALTGQIAGIASGIAVSNGTSPAKLDISSVQKAAASLGIVLHR